MLRPLLASIVFTAGCWLGGPAQAAEIRFVGPVTHRGSQAERFRLEGEISDVDAEKVRAALAGRGRRPGDRARPVIALDSGGGSYLAGLELATSFRRLGLATQVLSGDRCLSACALAFLGGAEPPADPTLPADAGPVPDQPPDRSIEPGARLGFHAPFLEIPDTSFTAAAVEQAYAAAVLGISRLIAVSALLDVAPAELPKLLVPARDRFYMVDHVDAVRLLGIEYTDYRLQIRNLESFTKSMILNACINRYYHLQRRSALSGHAAAAAIRDEFVEGSILLENGEESLVFGVREVPMGVGQTRLAFSPIARTADGRRFVWCLFQPGPGLPTTFYKPAGTVSELFAELSGGGDVWDFETSQTTLTVGRAASDRHVLLRVLDMAPPETRLTDVGAVMRHYQATEARIGAPK